MTPSSSSSKHEGDSIPDLELHVVEHGQQRRAESPALFGNKTVIVFALPGAFTPTCSSQHLPRYEELAPRFRQHGVDTLICVSVNDPFVMSEWARDQGVHEVLLIADGNGAFTEAMGMIADGSEQCMGRRSRRYSMLIRDGVIEKMFVEPDQPGNPYGESAADTMLRHLAPALPPEPRVAILTKPGCPFCAKAKAMLDEQGWRYAEVALPDATRGRVLSAITGKTSAPQVFIDGRLVGGSEELSAELARRRQRSASSLAAVAG